MTLTFGAAKTLAAELLEATGMAAGPARATARAIAVADAWGLGSHGLLRLPYYLDRLAAGGYPPHAELTVTADTGPLVTFDGGGGLGHWQLDHAQRLAVERARQHGVALVGVANSGHCGALGVYVADIAAAGCVGLLFSDGPAVLPAWEGDRPLLSTSPVAGAVPGEPGPAVVDLALSTVARGKIAAYASAGRELPDGWALDAQGQPTTDPQQALKGMLAPLGGAKGFALAFLVEALTAGLLGPSLSADQPDFYDARSNARPQGIAHLLLAIDPRQLGGGSAEAPARRLADLRQRIEGSGGRVPGSRRGAPGDLPDDLALDVDERVLTDLRRRRQSVVVTA